MLLFNIWLILVQDNEKRKKSQWSRKSYNSNFQIQDINY